MDKVTKEVIRYPRELENEIKLAFRKAYPKVHMGFKYYEFRKYYLLRMGTEADKQAVVINEVEIEMSKV